MNSDNPDCANTPKYFANHPALQLTLRQLLTMIANYKFWIGFCAVVFFLALTGPFGTQSSMEFSPRLVYWAVISFCTFFTGSAISMAISNKLDSYELPNWVTWGISGLVTGPPVGILVWVLSIYLFGIDLAGQFSFLVFIAYVTAIAIIIVILNHLISSDRNADNSYTQPHNTRSSFFSRLPKQLGKDLISLEAQDHYVLATTSKGKELILMRLSDAEKELTDHPGLRVHRSWWVAKNAIKQIHRKNGKVEIEMIDGCRIPVSRSYAQVLTKLGL